uniref:Pseudouridine synthase YOR243C n=1 Tax=Caligus clemensi TaxID=344056 RepID=C1C1Y2_CALCM|nr:pseudouridine synthase YOR243C [Caligus clemensi]
MEEGASHEAKFGISEYITKDVDGFRGILKHRYSDFLVNEVDLDGKIIRFSGPSLPKVEPVKVEAKDLDYTVHGELSAEVKALFSPLTWTRLIQMSKKYAGNDIYSHLEVVFLNK